VVITEVIAPYRIPVFNSLSALEGVDLHVIFLAETHPTLRQWLVYKDEIQFSFEVLRSFRRGLVGYDVIIHRGLRSALLSSRPDVVICGGYSYAASWEAMVWSKMHRIPFVLWCESNAEDKRGNRVFVELLKRMFLAGCSGYIVPGRASFKYIKGFGVPDGLITTAPNAVDIRLFSSKAVEAKKEERAIRRKLGLPSRYFIYVGRLVTEKGLFDLLEAYGGLEERLKADVGAVFVGDGREKSELLKQAASIHPGNVQCVGFVQREEMPSYYALAEALVFPTLTDP